MNNPGIAIRLTGIAVVAVVMGGCALMPSSQSAPPATTSAMDHNLPTIRTHREKDKLVEEYYRHGQLYMVRVLPDKGEPYVRFVGEKPVSQGVDVTPPPGNGPHVKPVQYHVLDWGKPSE